MLTIAGLSVKTSTNKVLLDDISFALSKKEILLLTGSSGSGKTTLLKAIMGNEENVVSCDYFNIDGHQVLEIKNKERRNLCGSILGFIPQNPMTAFHPKQSIGKQMCQTISIKKKISLQEALTLASQSLNDVNLTETQRILESYPNELSGGMLQRIAIAICFALKPHFILADEPTVFLDQENKQIILKLLKQCTKYAGIILVTHDLEIIKQLQAQMLVIENGTVSYYGNFADGYQKFEADNPLNPVVSQQNFNAEESRFLWKNYVV